MANPKTELGTLHKRCLYGAVAVVWISGCLWLVDKHFRQVQTDFGLQAPATQSIWLEIHGGAAMAFLLLFGSLMPNHIRFGWKRKDRRPSGGVSAGISIFLILTGWGLYYAGEQELRRTISLIHWAAGLLLPLFIAVHVLSARSVKKKHPANPPIAETDLSPT